MVSFSLHQVTRFDGASYVVTNTVDQAQSASPAVYVYKTAGQVFSNYASAADMEAWPDNLAAAQQAGAMFYRLPTVTRKWDTVVAMNADLDTSLRRLQSLADELNAVRASVAIDRVTVVVGA